jgi:hypothetical protein
VGIGLLWLRRAKSYKTRGRKSPDAFIHTVSSPRLRCYPGHTS